jgi:hypothetical protein
MRPGHLAKINAWFVEQIEALKAEGANERGEENEFTFQYGTLDGKTGRWLTPIPTVTHWLKLVDRE